MWPHTRRLAEALVSIVAQEVQRGNGNGGNTIALDEEDSEIMCWGSAGRFPLTCSQAA